MARVIGEHPARLDGPEELFPAPVLAIFVWTTMNLSSRGTMCASPAAGAVEALAAKIRRVQGG
jgi:hypothetical protein